MKMLRTQWLTAILLLLVPVWVQAVMPQVTASEYDTFGLKSNGTVFGWG